MCLRYDNHSKRRRGEELSGTEAGLAGTFLHDIHAEKWLSLSTDSRVDTDRSPWTCGFQDIDLTGLGECPKPV